jgi:photosystem II stability/assembly factor-like uncharacterized protein
MSLDFIDEVERQLVAATERGLSRRQLRWARLARLRLPWRAPTIGIAAGVGAALAASAIAATLTLPASHPKPRVVAHVRPAVLSFTTAGRVPRGYQPASFTAISEFTWWVLGQAPCHGHPCTTIAYTDNGGRSFTRVAAPPTSDVSQLRFANALDGYAFGPQLWSTRNGGRSWRRASPRGTVTELAASGPYVFAVATLRGRAMLLRSPVGTDTWTVVQDVVGSPIGSLWVQGDTVIVQAGAHVLISGDQGAHFSRARGAGLADDCGFDATVDASVIWAMCSTGTAPDEVLRSTDGGATFRFTTHGLDGPLENFAAASPDAAVVAGQGPLTRTADGGATWSRSSAPAAAWIYLGFTDATHGVAIGNVSMGARPKFRLYYTIDAGASYHYVPIGSP